MEEIDSREGILILGRKLCKYKADIKPISKLLALEIDYLNKIERALNL